MVSKTVDASKVESYHVIRPGHLNVTNRLYGAYNYEGGNQVYTITYGDRSMTEPEYDASLAYKGEQEQKKAPAADVLLYVGIGVIALAAIGGAVLMITKKKKSAGAESK